VAKRLASVGDECAGRTNKVRLSCANSGDALARCFEVPDGAVVLAYSQGSVPDEVNLCPAFFDLPLVTNVCHEPSHDQATTLIHEITHIPGIADPPTTDEAYGYNLSKYLDQARSLSNADTYALYANSEYDDFIIDWTHLTDLVLGVYVSGLGIPCQ
jgi:Lysine-specific metallo-endopeptidase